jgi:hypothetical protein
MMESLYRQEFLRDPIKGLKVLNIPVVYKIEMILPTLFDLLSGKQSKGLVRGDLFFLPNQIDRGQCKWLSTYFGICGAPYQKLCEQLWELMVFSDSKLTNVSLNLTTDLRTEEVKFTSFLSMYKHWSKISSLTISKARPLPVHRKRPNLALTIYQVPSLALVPFELPNLREMDLLFKEVEGKGAARSVVWYRSLGNRVPLSWVLAFSYLIPKN